MKKIKFLIAGLFSAIALVFACVVGTRVNATATNASVYDGTYDYKISIANLTTNTFSVYGTSKTGVKQSESNDLVALDGNWNWYDSALSSDLSITNNTGHTFNSFAVPTGGRKVTFKVPSGQTKISVEVYLLSLVKAGNNNQYTCSTSALTATFAAENTTAKVDDAATKVSGTVATIDGDSTIHKLSFDYTSSTDVTLQSGLTILGVVANNVATAGYNVTYVSEHGTAPSQLTEQTTLPATLPSMSATGYTFGGWYTDSNCTEGNEAVAGDALSGSITLYAKWTVNTSEWCTITFDANGGTCATANASAVFGSSYTLPEVTKSGYAFGGWSDGTNTYSDTYTVPSQSSVTLTAQWTELLTFNVSCSFQKNDPKIVTSTSSFFTNTVDDGDKFTTQDASGSYNGVSYSVGLKLEGSTKLKFTPAKNGTLYIAMSNASATVSVNGTQKTASNHVVIVSIEADTEITLSRGADQQFILFIGLIYDKLSDDTTAAVFAEKNTAGDTLRFVGTLTGITALANIDKIELFLEKDGVAAANPIELTTCYTSVINTSKTCAEANNTYYVIFRLTGIDKLAAGTIISKQLKVTFTDGSSTISDVTEITL